MSYNTETRDILAALGVTGSKLPAEGTGTLRDYPGGWTVWVEPKPATAPVRRRGAAKHRTMAECQYCDKRVSAGRMGQHRKACRHSYAEDTIVLA